MTIFSSYILKIEIFKPLENGAEMIFPYDNPLCHSPLATIPQNCHVKTKKQEKPNQTKPKQTPTKTRNHSVPEDNFQL